ncbi:MAG: DUF4394 domain-containing protein [Methylobacterium mesophilicum]|nr:DUF4394 domain-containing protein [Methylobacterium mesophilicum]
MKTIAIAAAGSLLALWASTANAATIVALSGDNTLVTVDTETKAATATQTVSGAEGKLLGIDVRPSDKKLYGLFADGTVATIDPATGAATKVDMLKMVPPADATVTVDFNPAADALRIMGSDGTSLRTKFADGAVTEDGRHSFAEGDMNKGSTPNVIAGAYTNSYAGTEKTALYNIDGTAGALLHQDPPNDGTLKSVGKLNVSLDGPVAFDILSDGKGGNEAWLMSGAKLYSVDLASGAATEAATITGVEGAVRDIAILPAM